MKGLMASAFSLGNKIGILITKFLCARIYQAIRPPGVV